MSSILSLRDPYLIDPSHGGGGLSKGCHISIPESGVQCGVSTDWSDYRKYRLDIADSSQFEVCPDCLAELATHAESSFRRFFPDMDINDWRSEQGQVEDDMPRCGGECVDGSYCRAIVSSEDERCPEHPRGNTAILGGRDWGDEIPVEITGMPSNVSRDIKSVLTNGGGEIQGLKLPNDGFHGESPEQCDISVIKETFEFMGRWREWYVFAFKRKCTGCGHRVNHVVAPVLRDRFTDEQQAELESQLRACPCGFRVAGQVN